MNKEQIIATLDALKDDLETALNRVNITMKILKKGGEKENEDI